MLEHLELDARLSKSAPFAYESEDNIVSGGFPHQISHPIINWLQIRMIPDSADGDTLYIFDCCFAATSAVRNMETEYLAASASELSTTSHKNNRLTYRFLELLKRYHHTPMTVASYHSFLLAEMDQPTRRPDRTPVYVPSFSREAIVLEPMAPRNTTLQLLQSYNVCPAKVLVTIHLEGLAAIPTVDDFEKYLVSRVPQQIADIRVEAVFKAESQLLLVTLPAALWDLLREDENINFVAHVMSTNLLCSET